MSNRSHSTSYIFQLSQRRGELKNRQYEKGHKLGEGGFAACYKATRYSDGKVLAMKIIKLNDRKQLSSSRDRHRVSNHPKLSTLQKANSQAKLLRMCNHSNIVRYETDFVYENNFYLVMEYCQKGVPFLIKQNLAQMLKRRETLSQVETRYYLRQMVEGLQYLKERKIIHREQVLQYQSLKPANFLLTDKLRLKIADFGLATEVRNSQPQLKNVCGTPNYISPEMIARSQYSYQVDLWSVGVIMYSMLYGVAPFETKRKEAQQTYEKIRKCQYKLIDPRVSSEARNLISKILVPNPQERIKLQDIFKHPFMTNFQIPHQLSLRFLKQHPDEKFLELYEFQKHQQIKSQNKDSKKESMIPQISGIKDSFQNSFSLSSQCSLSENVSKKDRKRQKKEQKQEQRRIFLKRKSVAEVVKKFQKEEILTQSPYSEAQSLYKSQKNKWIQYPSYQGKSQTKFVNIEKDKRKLDQTLKSKGKQKKTNDNQCERQIQKQKLQEQTFGIGFKEFPSFSSMLKKLSFQEMVDQKQEQNHIFKYQTFIKSKRNQKKLNFDELYKKVKLDHKMIKSKEFDLSENESKICEKGIIEQNSFLKSEYRIVKKQKQYQNEKKQNDNGDEKKQKDYPKQQQQIVYPQQQQQIVYSQQVKLKDHAQQIIKKVYVVEDFLLFTSSLNQSTIKMMKLIYCLRQEKVNYDENNLNKKNNYNLFDDVSSAKFIGIIFHDNSSIVTKVFIQNKQIYTKSIYIQNINVNIVSNNNNKHSFSKLLSSQQFEHLISQSQQNQTQNDIYLGSNIFNFDKIIKETQTKTINQKDENQKLKVQALPYQIRLKIRHARDANRYFAHLISQTALNSTLLNHHNHNDIFKKNKDQFTQSDNYVFVKFFSSEHNQKKVYFEFNNQSKHLMSLISKQNHYQDFFNNKKIQKKPKFCLYDLVIYNSTTKIGFIKLQLNGLKALRWQSLKSLLFLNEYDKDQIEVKKCEQDSEDQQPIKRKNSHQKIINHSNLISELCLSFHEKMEFYYLRQKKLLKIFHQQKQNKKSKESELCFQENKCEVKIKNGFFDIQIQKKQAINLMIIEEKDFKQK